ncbi:hypothetical protein DPMN_096300 [Dreissena polymorpha]|uniref:Uncharacterized protein n=1 Tax=Dreissena polymorpha TaxID=45954 RepID=A0A9D4R4C7_DREPO|nr:hypothetical protein DPMN_096300 [Dreissena polymorpha]
MMHAKWHCTPSVNNGHIGGVYQFNGFACLFCIAWKTSTGTPSDGGGGGGGRGKAVGDDDCDYDKDCNADTKILMMIMGIRYVCYKSLVYDVYDSCEEDDSDGKDGEDGDNDDGYCMLKRIIKMMNMADIERMMIDAAVDVDKNEDL